jgi:hypothetical protein
MKTKYLIKGLSSTPFSKQIIANVEYIDDGNYICGESN